MERMRMLESLLPPVGSDGRSFADAIKAVGGGDRRPLFDLLADDVQWSVMGVKSWTRSYSGKTEVMNGMFGGISETKPEQQGAEVVAVIADGTRAVVEFSGFNTTPGGVRYNNRYCWIATFDSGRITELHEYMDTEMVSEVFGFNVALGET
jgi:ketosteroid isomerase-like protein